MRSVVSSPGSASQPEMPELFQLQGETVQGRSGEECRVSGLQVPLRIQSRAQDTRLGVMGKPLFPPRKRCRTSQTMLMAFSLRVKRSLKAEAAVGIDRVFF